MNLMEPVNQLPDPPWRCQCLRRQPRVVLPCLIMIDLHLLCLHLQMPDMGTIIQIIQIRRGGQRNRPSLLADQRRRALLPGTPRCPPLLGHLLPCRLRHLCHLPDLLPYTTNW